MSKKAKPLVFGTSGSLEGIQEVIAAFYCGSRKDLQADPMEPGTWRLYWPDLDKPPEQRRTAPLQGVQVRKVRKRGRDVFQLERR